MKRGVFIPNRTREDETFENQLRPRLLKEFIGQDQLRANLSVYLEAARKRKDVLDHVLFMGPPGLGKTTLAHIIAHELSVPLRVVSGPAVEKAGDLAAILTNLEPYSVLFIDEIHRLHPAVEEILYPAMEDYHLDLVVGQGAGARTMKITLSPFTLVAATTRAGLISSPLHSRFGIRERLDFYDPSALATIVFRSAKILKIPIDEASAEEIAKRGRGTPRIVNRLLRRVSDFALVQGDGKITLEITLHGLNQMGVDKHGLDEMDRRFLMVIVDQFKGGPVGLKALAASLGEDMGTLEDLVEPFLVQQGFILRTPRGRVATEKAYHVLKIPHPQKAQKDLFS